MLPASPGTRLHPSPPPLSWPGEWGRRGSRVTRPGPTAAGPSGLPLIRSHIHSFIHRPVGLFCSLDKPEFESRTPSPTRTPVPPSTNSHFPPTGWAKIPSTHSHFPPTGWAKIPSTHSHFPPTGWAKILTCFGFHFPHFKNSSDKFPLDFLDFNTRRLFIWSLNQKMYSYWLEHNNIPFSSLTSISDQDQEILCQLFSLQTIDF